MILGADNRAWLAYTTLTVTLCVHEIDAIKPHCAQQVSEPLAISCVPNKL
jgi:hypothetical protein